MWSHGALGDPIKIPWPGPCMQATERRTVYASTVPTVQSILKKVCGREQGGLGPLWAGRLASEARNLATKEPARQNKEAFLSKQCLHHEPTSRPRARPVRPARASCVEFTVRLKSLPHSIVCGPLFNVHKQATL